MKVELITPKNPAWDVFVAGVPHDVYHLSSYVQMSADQQSANEAAAVLVRDGQRTMFLPLILRPIPGTGEMRDAISPYGYPGPLVNGAADRDFFASASLAMTAQLRQSGIVSLFVRTHPSLNRDVEGMEAAGLIVGHGETVWIDLTASLEQLWSGTRPRDRSYINGAIRAGQRAFMDDDWGHEQQFVDLYLATMRRVGAGSEYMFGVDYVRALRDALGPRLHLCVVEIDGSVAAAGLFTEEDGIVQYHLSGTDEAFAQARPTKLMLHFVRGYMKERGNRLMNLGGGLGGAKDSLFDFKAGFSKLREPFHTWRVVVDPERYDSLSRARQPGSDPADLTGFFPLYRRAPA